MAVLTQDSWTQDLKYLSGALGIHALIGLLMIGFNWSSPQAIVPQLAIKAVLVDSTTLNQVVRQTAKPVIEKNDDEQAALEQQRQEQERLKQEELQQVQLKQRETERVEQQRLLAEAEQKNQLLQQRKAAEAEQKKQQELAKQQQDKQRIAEIQQKQRDAELKRQADADAKAQKALEAELSARMAAEEGRAAAVNSGLLNQYVALIQQKVMRNWNKPSTAKSGLECEVNVTQAAGGTVLSVSIGRCNGDQAVRTSIEAAVQRASPLPNPPDPRLFERNLLFIFKPTE
ncbi:MAG: TonB C-terminal domain-containing protein [Steroidobacteraceae bacterium]